MRYLLTILCFFCYISLSNAQESVDSLSLEIEGIPESLDADIDSLLRSWHVQYFSKQNEYCHDDVENVVFPDSIYRQRLESLPRVIPMTYNDVVRDCIDVYAERRRQLIRYMLGMADFYFPIIEPILDEYDLPIELKYLALVESALNPTALSRMGASGLWQFMLPTGKIYGLEINSLIDERRDPIKATHAACRYFKDMYEIYGDWYLVLASYNCGPGNISKAIKRANGKTDFWDIYRYLPRETRTYVPLFIAANYIMNFYCDHNICPIQTTMPLATDTIMVTQALHLEQVAEVLQMDIEQIRALNPQYRRDIIPGNIKPSVLKLPIDQMYVFIEREDTLFSHRAEELLTNAQAYVPSELVNSKSNKRERITHKVEAGENVRKIADRYGVTAKDVRRWNSLRSNNVAKGRRLTLYVDNGGVSFASPAKSETANTNTKEAKTNNGSITYKVKSGDSLYLIAKKHPGSTVKAIQQANGLSSTKLNIGQILIIPIG